MPQAGRHGDRRNVQVVGECVDINRADREELQMIGGIGDARAEQIIAWPERHGPFETVDDLQHLPLFGPDVMDHVQDRLTALAARRRAGHPASRRPRRGSVFRQCGRCV